MPPTRPRSLGELSLWLAGGETLASSLRGVCEVEQLDPRHWRQTLDSRSRDLRPGPAPAFLLVEGNGEAERRWRDELDDLLEACEPIGVPRLLWFTSSPIDPWWLERLDRFEQVFAAERWQVPELEAAGATEPTTLWPATALAVEPEPLAGGGEDEGGRPDPVVWLGGWRREWPAEWAERLTSVLRGAAERSLRIVPVAQLDGLPEDLGPCVAAEPADTAEKRHAALRRAKVAIGADPAVGSPTFVPPVVFDAAACGAAVITPHDFVTIHEMGVGSIADGTWRNMMPIVHDRDFAVMELDRLLDDDGYRGEVVGHMGRIVACNHTYAHRVATLASAAGQRLVPDAPQPVAA